MILLSLTRSNRQLDLGFSNDMQRLNVAITRAKSVCMIIGDVRHCYDSDNVGAMWQLIQMCDKDHLILDTDFNVVHLKDLPYNAPREAYEKKEQQRQLTALFRLYHSTQLNLIGKTSPNVYEMPKTMKLQHHIRAMLLQTSCLRVQCL